MAKPKGRLEGSIPSSDTIDMRNPLRLSSQNVARLYRQKPRRKGNKEHSEIENGFWIRVVTLTDPMRSLSPDSFARESVTALKYDAAPVGGSHVELRLRVV